jgi:hypothetical protein
VNNEINHEVNATVDTLGMDMDSMIVMPSVDTLGVLDLSVGMNMNSMIAKPSVLGFSRPVISQPVIAVFPPKRTLAVPDMAAIIAQYQALLNNTASQGDDGR